MPKRLQRSRRRGWRMPEGAVYVGRPTKWGNPFRIGMLFPIENGAPITAETAVSLFRASLNPSIMPDAAERRAEIRRELAGRDLVCWCRLGRPCHADVLLEIANGDERLHNACEATHKRQASPPP